MRGLTGLLAIVVALPAYGFAQAGVCPMRAVPRDAVPLAIASDEFNEDGARDIVCAYALESGGGLLAVSRGNPGALTSCGNVVREPFLGAPVLTVVECRPDLVATGDFDNDGHRDVAAATRGALSFTVHPGDRTGGFLESIRVAVGGPITAMTSGDANLADGLADLVVAIEGDDGPSLVVFEGPDGALKSAPERVTLPSTARSLSIAQAEGPNFGDVVAGCDDCVAIVVGRNRCDLAGQRPVPTAPPVVQVRHDVSAPLRITAVTLAARLNGDAIDDVVEFLPDSPDPVVRLSSPQATFTVTSAADSGTGTLRDALTLANASPGADEIDFAIGTGPATIALQSRLPEVTDPVTIDGTSQPEFDGAPIVTISGSATADAALLVTAGNSTLRGLAIENFPYNESGSNAAVTLRDGGSNRVEGCLFGSDVEGDELSNGRSLLLVSSVGNSIGSPVPAARNLFCRTSDGVTIFFDSAETVIQNNVFGTDASLTSRLSTGNGVAIDNVPRNRIGGVLPGEGNITVNAFNYGFDIISNNAAENLIQGNWIGTTPDRRSGFGNSEGVGICGGANNGAKANLVGGTAAGAANVIAGNSNGVSIGTAPDVDATENRILCNEIYDSELIGIDLGQDSNSFNDPTDSDLGPNEQQNCPVLESLEIAGDTARVTGSLTTRPNEAFRVEFYSGSSATRIGFGDGGVIVGATNITTNAGGFAAIDFAIPTAALRGESIVATATDASGDTSEFSVSLQLSVRWVEPDPNAGTNPPPRNPSVAVRNYTDDLPTPAPAATPAGFLGYNVYKGNNPNFAIGPATLFQGAVPSTSVSSFVLASGAFFRITAVYGTGESSPTDAIGGGTPPVLSSCVFKRGKIVTQGTGLTGTVLVFMNGIPFQQQAKVKANATRVVQKGITLFGDAIGDVLGNFGVVTVLVRNGSGGTASIRLTR